MPIIVVVADCPIAMLFMVVFPMKWSLSVRIPSTERYAATVNSSTASSLPVLLTSISTDIEFPELELSGLVIFSSTRLGIGRE